MDEANSYEEQRRRQIEQNKRKLDELRVHRLSAAVRQAAAKPMPAKLLMPRNPRLDAPTRRFGRIASLPEQPDYGIRKAIGDYIPAHFTQYLPVHDEMMVLVDEVNKKEFAMLYRVSYKHQKRYLNEWREFSAYHELADGDCLVLQLIERRKFKVYIVRASSYNNNDH
ncbi:hypothetical protein ACQ4PT_070117 [Festuca glaucescens]